MHGSKSRSFFGGAQPSHNSGTSEQTEGGRLYHPIQPPFECGDICLVMGRGFRKVHAENSWTDFHDQYAEPASSRESCLKRIIDQYNSHWLMESLPSCPEDSHSPNPMDTERIGTDTAQPNPVIPGIPKHLRSGVKQDHIDYGSAHVWGSLGCLDSRDFASSTCGSSHIPGANNSLTDLRPIDTEDDEHKYACPGAFGFSASPLNDDLLWYHRHNGSNWPHNGHQRTNTNTSQYSSHDIRWWEQAEETSDNDLKRIKSIKLSLDAAQSDTSKSENPKHSQPGKMEDESNLVTPYENLIGTTLGTSFRILKLLRSESHGDVYDLENLLPSSARHEAKAYILRSLPANTYRYRVRNLKRLAAKPSFLCSIDQCGRKFVINSVQGKQYEPSTPFPRVFKSLRSSKMGDIGRQNSPEYSTAFIEFPKVTDSISPFTSTHGCQSVSTWDKFSPSSRVGERATKFSSVQNTTLHNILAPVQLFLQEEEALSRVPRGSSDYIAAIVKEAYAAITIVGTEAADNVGMNTTALTSHCALETNRRATEEQQRKIKTPEQRERLRARQRESRIRKRAQEKAASAKGASDLV